MIWIQVYYITQYQTTKINHVLHFEILYVSAKYIYVKDNDRSSTELTEEQLRSV